MAPLRTTLLLALLVAVAACDVTHQRRFIAPRYEPEVFGYAAGRRDLKVEVIGNPSSLNQTAFAQAVVDAMQGHNPGQPTHLTLTPGPSARPLYRVVVAFNPLEPVGIHDLCRGERITTAPTADSLQVRAAFCEGAGALTAVRGRAPADTDVDDADFQSLLAGMTRTLLPRDNPESFEDRDDCLVPVPFGCS